MKASVGGILSAVLIIGFAGCSSDSETSTIFELLIENISQPADLTNSDGSPAGVFFSGGVGAVHTEPAPLFSFGQPARANGLEALAEDGDPTDLIEALGTPPDISLIVGTQVPVVENEEEEDAAAGFLQPGQKYRLLFNVEDETAKLSFAFSFLQANDLIVTTGESGITLFNADGTPRGGDVTGEFSLVDVGTEVNEEPARGPNQALRQMEPNTGPAEGGVVRPVDDGFTYPSIAGTLKITLTQVDRID